MERLKEIRVHVAFEGELLFLEISKYLLPQDPSPVSVSLSLASIP